MAKPSLSFSTQSGRSNRRQPPCADDTHRRYETGNPRHTLGEQPLLHFAGNLDFPVHPLSICRLVCERPDELRNRAPTQSVLPPIATLSGPSACRAPLISLALGSINPNISARPGSGSSNSALISRFKIFLLHRRARTTFRTILVYGCRPVGASNFGQSSRIFRLIRRGHRNRAQRLLQMENLAAAQQHRNLRDVEDLRNAREEYVEMGLLSMNLRICSRSSLKMTSLLYSSRKNFRSSHRCILLTEAVPHNEYPKQNGNAYRKEYQVPKPDVLSSASSGRKPKEDRKPPTRSPAVTIVTFANRYLVPILSRIRASMARCTMRTWRG